MKNVIEVSERKVYAYKKEPCYYYTIIYKHNIFPVICKEYTINDISLEELKELYELIGNILKKEGGNE